jgi:hypothetical protein
VSATVYGPLVAASDVEDALLTLLGNWMPSYLAELERHHNYAVGSLPQVRSWVRSAEVEKFPEDQLPCVMLASPGLTDAPVTDGDGRYTARWRVLVAAEIAARGNRLALALARLYATGLRAIAVQQQALAGLDVRRVDWMGERYDVLDSADDRTTCIAQVELAVEIADVTDRNAGPLVPEVTPGPDSPTWTAVDVVVVEIQKVPLEEVP